MSLATLKCITHYRQAVVVLVLFPTLQFQYLTIIQSQTSTHTLYRSFLANQRKKFVKETYKIMPGKLSVLQCLLLCYSLEFTASPF